MNKVLASFTNYIFSHSYFNQHHSSHLSMDLNSGPSYSRVKMYNFHYINLVDKWLVMVIRVIKHETICFPLVTG